MCDVLSANAETAILSPDTQYGHKCTKYLHSLTADQTTHVIVCHRVVLSSLFFLHHFSKKKSFHDTMTLT